MASKAISTLVLSGVFVAFFGITMALCHGAGPDYLDRYAALAPEDASFVAAIVPPQQLVEEFAFDIADGERAQLAMAIGADLLDSGTWRRFGINPIAPIGVVGWGSNSARTLIFGAHGRAENGRDQLAAWLGGAGAVSPERGELRGMPALTSEGRFVVVYSRRHVFVAFGSRYEAEGRIAELLGDTERFTVHTGMRSATDFDGRPLVSIVARPAGFAETPEQVVTFNRSPGHEFSLVGFALAVGPDGLAIQSRAFAGSESEALAAVDGGLRTNRGLAFAPGPARLALGGAVAPTEFFELVEQSMQLRVGSAQRFAGAIGEFSAQTGTTAEDTVAMLTGEYGLVVTSLPPFDAEFGAVGYLGLRDPMAVIAMASAMNDSNAGGERREIGGVTLFSTGLPALPAISVLDGFAWFATSEDLLASTIRGEAERLRSASPVAYSALREASAGSLFVDLTTDGIEDALDLRGPAESLTIEMSVGRGALLGNALVDGSTEAWRQILITRLLAEHGIEREQPEDSSETDESDRTADGSGHD